MLAGHRPPSFRASPPPQVLSLSAPAPPHAAWPQGRATLRLGGPRRCAWMGLSAPRGSPVHGAVMLTAWLWASFTPRLCFPKIRERRKLALFSCCPLEVPQSFWGSGGQWGWGFPVVPSHPPCSCQSSSYRLCTFYSGKKEF